jgi:hypothetical protein
MIFGEKIMASVIFEADRPIAPPKNEVACFWPTKKWMVLD